jgi:hypothetical protein
MSRLESAKAAINAELSHAREGAAYYQSLVDALEGALERLDSVGPKTGKTREGLARPVKAKGGRGRQSRSTGNGRGGGLPPTGQKFWAELVDAQPKSAVEVVHRAVEKLGFSPSRDQVKNLSQRATYALTTLVKSGAINDSGSGRARRFFRAP